MDASVIIINIIIILISQSDHCHPASPNTLTAELCNWIAAVLQCEKWSRLKS